MNPVCLSEIESWLRGFIRKVIEDIKAEEAIEKEERVRESNVSGV